MLIADVNVLLSAHRSDAVHHAACGRWLDESAYADTPMGVSELVLSGVVRIASNRRVFDRPSTIEDALAFCEQVRSVPAARVVVPGSRHWSIFAELCRKSHARANVVPDAYLAALAIENSAVFVTMDRGFAQFRGLRLVDPLRR